MLAAPLPAVWSKADALLAPESSAWLSQPCHTVPCWQHVTGWRWTSVTAQSSRADSSPQLPGCSLAQNRRKHVMLLVLSFFHGSTFKCFAEKHQELSSAAHRTRCEIFREKLCQKSRMELLRAAVAFSDNARFFSGKFSRFHFEWETCSYGIAGIFHGGVPTVVEEVK